MNLDLVSTDVNPGVTAVIHTASPISSKNTKWEDAITPAVQGSLGILNSAYKHAGPKLESFVLTSSVAAVSDPSKKTHCFTEADWNEWAEPKAKSGESSALYSASKTLAERAIWEFRDEKKVRFLFRLVSFKPSTSQPLDLLARILYFSRTTRCRHRPSCSATRKSRRPEHDHQTSMGDLFGRLRGRL